MKLLKCFFFSTAALLLINTSPLSACEIEFKTLIEDKEIYEIDDEIIVLLIVKFTHRICPEGILNTEYKTDGLKIGAATKWKETLPGVTKTRTVVIIYVILLHTVIRFL